MAMRSGQENKGRKSRKFPNQPKWKVRCRLHLPIRAEAHVLVSETESQNKKHVFLITVNTAFSVDMSPCSRVKTRHVLTLKMELHPTDKRLC